MHSSSGHPLEFLVLLFPCLIAACAVIFVLLTLAVWIWALLEAVTKESSEGNDKVVWVLVVLLTGIVGAAIYLLVRRPERKRTLGR
jgi:CDP-diglyceride synthetase